MAKRIDANSYDSTRVKRKELKRLVISGLISLLVVGLFFWATFELFPLTARLPKTVTSGGTVILLDWGLLGNMVSVVTLALVVGGVVFAVSQYIENADQRRREAAQAQFSMYDDVFDRFMNQEAMSARRWIILNLPTLDGAGNDSEAWLAQTKALIKAAPAGKAYLKQVLNDFDFLGFVAQHYWSMDNELVEWMSGPVVKTWERVYLYVEREGLERNEPDFYKSARWFGQHCMEWRRQRFPKSEIISDAT